MSAIIRAGALRGYSTLVEDLGGSPVRLLRSVGLNLQALEDEDALIPLRAHIRLMEHSARQLRCPDFGLRLGQRQDAGILGPLALAMRHAATVGEALRFASQRLFIQSQAITLTIVRDDHRHTGCVELRLQVVEGRYGPSRQFLDQCLAVLDRVSRILVGNSYELRSVYLEHEPVAPLANYRKAFGTAVHPSQSHCSLMLDAKFLDAPVRTFDAVLRKMAIDYLDTRFGDPQHAISARVRHVLSGYFGSVIPSRARVASALGLNERTLQRHLAREGISFETLRDDVRQQTTRHYLVNSALPVAQIADLVGLSQTSALTRCCLRWFGKTPTQMRAISPVLSTPRAAKRKTSRSDTP